MRRATTVAAGVVTGFIAGFTFWSRQQRVDARALFNRNPLRRLAALGHLGVADDERSVALLREYVRWEPRPRLRRRARRLLRRAEHTLA